MKIAVWIDKNAALKAGSDIHGWVTLDIPAAQIPDPVRDVLVKNLEYMNTNEAPKNADYVVRWSFKVMIEGGISVGSVRINGPAIPTAESVLSALSTVPALIAAEIEKREAKKAAELADARQRVLDYIAAPLSDRIGRSVTRGSDVPSDLHSAFSAALAEVEAERARIKAAREAAEKQAENEKRAQLQAAVDALSPQDSDRFRDGKMPAREVIDLITAAAMKPIEDAGMEWEQQDVYLTTTDCSCDSDFFRRTDDDITHASREEYAELAKARTLLGIDGDNGLGREVSRCSDCDARAEAVYARLEFPAPQFPAVEVRVQVVLSRS